MSVRAYRINKIDHEKSETFNLWHNEKLNEFFENEYGLYETLVEGVGITELPIEALQEAIKNKKKLKLDDDLIDSLKTDIVWAKKNNEDYIQYYCY